MMALQTPALAASWLRQCTTGTLQSDSRQLKAGDGFVAWPGAATDGRQYVHAALKQGATACLVERAGSEAYDFSDPRVASYEGLKAATAAIAAAYFGEPSDHLEVLAVTGTNGKTSTAWWLAQALSQLGSRCAVAGTLGIGEPGAMVFNGLTTPDPVLFQQQLRRFVDEGFAACAVEASSIGLAEGRLDATRLRLAVFTNFTQDHLDYHGSMPAYWAAKQRLFDWPGLQTAVVNIDDPRGAALAVSLDRPGLELWTTSCGGAARLQAQAVQHGLDSMIFDVVEAGRRCRVSAPMVGQYNVSNLLGVIAALRSLGISLEAAARVCSLITPVPGRMETLATEGRPLVVVDYAHTPDALDKVLLALRPVAQSRGGELWCIFGCGGDRDPLKRPLMAAAAEQSADRLVVTSDNPRSEEPLAIIGQMLLGLKRRDAVHVEPDRALAIAHALRAAQAGDVVLIAGKGHEDYQEVRGVKLPFSDRAQAEAVLRSGGARQAATGASA